MGSMPWQDDDYADILRYSKTIAVVGLSNDRFRPSSGVARYLQQEGYRYVRCASACSLNSSETDLPCSPVAIK